MENLTLLVVIATYNEIDSLPLLIERISQLLPDANILVVDDNSPDGTGTWCDRFSADDPRLHVIHRNGKLGLGTATILGLNRALDSDYQFVATMDADLSHDPTVLAEMLSLISPQKQVSLKRQDVVIGSRYVPGGQIIGWPIYRRIASRLVNWYARFLLRLDTFDNTSAFRIYRVDALREIDLSRIESSGYSYLEEILLRLKQSGANFFETPITFNNRTTGKSKVDFTELAHSLYQMLRLSFSGSTFRKRNK